MRYNYQKMRDEIAAQLDGDEHAEWAGMPTDDRNEFIVFDDDTDEIDLDASVAAFRAWLES